VPSPYDVSMSESLIIVGASARAAAFSAATAQLNPACADFFGDTDLVHVAPTKTVERYPKGLADAASELPAGPWMYTGALENYPQLVDRIAAERVLYGNPGSVLRRVRDPFLLRDELRSSELRLPELARASDQLPLDGSWLYKPLASSSGDRIFPWTKDVLEELEKRADPKKERHYFQQRIEGMPCSALFFAAAGKACLLGVTRQITGEAWTGATGFKYAGSVGPLSLPQEPLTRLQLAAARIASTFGLIGLFGLDLIWANNDLWLIEINPRYPASAEVLERSLGISAVGTHARACEKNGSAGAMASIVYNSQGTEMCAGKAIAYADKDFKITESFSHWASEQNAENERYVVADIPAVGTFVPAGFPIATVLADGTNAKDVEEKLKKRLSELRRSL